MKLILSVDALSPELSGIGRYAWELASRLKQAPSIEHIRYFRAGQWVQDPAELLKVSFPGRKRHFKVPRWGQKWYWQRVCRNHIFHAPNYFLPPYAENGVATIHDLSVFKYPETHPVERVKQFEKFLTQTLSIATYLITDSESIRREVVDFFNWPEERTAVVHLGVSSSFAPQPESSLRPRLKRLGLAFGKYTLCVSTIEPRKRIDALIEAYGAMDKCLRDIYPLVLVGGGGWKNDYLYKLIGRGEAAGWLHYLGFVAEEELPAIYAGARLFVYPSIYEGFGLPVAEAMASGIPVITSDRSSLPEIAGGAAELIDPDDINALTAGLVKGLMDVKWRKEAIALGLKVAESYNWEKCVEQTIAVYARVGGS